MSRWKCIICPQGPHRAANSDRDLAHSHNLYNLHFDVRYKNTVFAGCRVHQTDRTGENTTFFNVFKRFISPTKHDLSKWPSLSYEANKCNNTPLNI